MARHSLSFRVGYALEVGGVGKGMGGGLSLKVNRKVENCPVETIEPGTFNCTLLPQPQGSGTPPARRLVTTRSFLEPIREPEIMHQVNSFALNWPNKVILDYYPSPNPKAPLGLLRYIQKLPPESCPLQHLVMQLLWEINSY
jgi:hypothetical protein